MLRQRLWFAVMAVCLGLLQACATPASPQHANAVLLPLQSAWHEGKLVRYVTTDVSTADMAQDKGGNTAPRLAALVPGAAVSNVGSPSALERVYMVDGLVQHPVFPSVPQPVGPGSADAGYSPLWRIVVVRWQSAHTPRELRAEEAVLQAADRGEVVLEITDVVVNCPVVWVEGGPALPGARMFLIGNAG